jgi:hypothetical protein
LFEPVNGSVPLPVVRAAVAFNTRVVGAELDAGPTTVVGDVVLPAKATVVVLPEATVVDVLVGTGTVVVDSGTLELVTVPTVVVVAAAVVVVAVPQVRLTVSSKCCGPSCVQLTSTVTLAVAPNMPAVAPEMSTLKELVAAFTTLSDVMVP